MKKVLSLIFLAILLFFAKEQLRAQCNMGGYNTVQENPDGGFDAYFTEQPGTGCIFNYGFGTVDSIKAKWGFYVEGCGTTWIEADPKDTLHFETFGTTYVFCSAVYYRKNKPNAVAQLTNTCVIGADDVDCPTVAPILPPAIDTTIETDTNATTTTEPPPQNSYSVQNGVISLEGSGIFVVLDFATMLPIVATDFEGALVYDLNLCCGSGMYLCNIVFAMPCETVEFVTQI